MKIRLKNFRSYEDETFDLGNDGLVLITAPSGSGKSNILLGINFALYGTGTKVVKHGKTSCSVELIFGDMKIVRSKRPNRLIVNDDYADDAAQNIINKKFGDSFSVTGYIAQNALNSFIVMSPTDKLSFLETFAFKDVNLLELKKKCKDIIDKRYEQLNNTITQLETAKSILKELIKPEVVNFPFKCKDKDKAIKNEEIRYKNCDVIIKRCRNFISKIQKEINDTLVLTTMIENKQENVSNLKKKLANIVSSISEIDYIGDKVLNEKVNILDKIIKAKEYIEVKNTLNLDIKKLDDMKVEEIEKYKNEIKLLEDEFSREFEEETMDIAITNYEESVSITKSCLEDAKKVNFLVNQLSKYNEVDNDSLLLLKENLSIKNSKLDEMKELLEKLKLQKELFSCPSCDIKLKIKENKLYVADDICNNNHKSPKEVQNDIKILQIEINDLQKEINEKENDMKMRCKLQGEIDDIKCQYEEELDESSLKEDLDIFKTNLSLVKKLKDKYEDISSKLKTNDFSSSYLSFEKNIEKQKKSLEKFKEIDDDDLNLIESIDEEELRNVINREKQNKINMTKLVNDKKILEIDIDSLENEIKTKRESHIGLYGEINSVEKLNKSVYEKEEEIQETENKKIEHKQNLELIEKYKNYMNEKDKYETLENKIKEYESQEILDRKRYSASTLLKEKILEAESIAMINIIESINTHSQIYLDSFFPDDPIVVRLLPFKESKKNTKPQINIEIDYRGMECDFSMISGGQLSRIILAFTLALGEMFNTPMLLLDECTSSLGQDMTTTVFNGIKEHFTGKLVIIVAHQVVTGIFDKIINLQQQ